ncbi:MAG: radical SAM protein [Sandaracinaceae bacterium]|nr:radical SAM protein [Sandaracinaceae bacterium]
MRVALVTVYAHAGCTLKDVAGGYGTVFAVGSSWRARLLERAKARVAALPSLTLGYLAAQLARAGHTVSAHEVRGADALPAVDAAVILSSMVDASAERDLAARLRRRGIRTIVVGAFASARPELYADGADVVVVGEPEALGAALLDTPDGVVRAGDAPDLDALPFPDWSAFDVAGFRYAFLGFSAPTLPIGSARGCAYGCGYCPWRVTARFRERDPERVGREVAHQVARHDARGFAFRDPLFNLDRDRTLALARALAPHGVRFSAEMRADRLDPALLDALARAGLRSLEIGVESSDRALLAKERRNPPEARVIEEVVRVAQRRGVRVICNFILGLPDDDEASMRRTLAWARRLDSFAVQFTVATPYPGTRLADQVRALPLAPDAHTGFAPTFRHPRLGGAELTTLREHAYVQHYFRPRYAARFLRHAVPALLEDVLGRGGRGDVPHA